MPPGYSVPVLSLTIPNSGYLGSKRSTKGGRAHRPDKWQKNLSKSKIRPHFNTFSLLTLSIRDTIIQLTMNLLKSTLLASLVAAAANAQEEEPSIPNLNGQNFKITVR